MKYLWTFFSCIDSYDILFYEEVAVVKRKWQDRSQNEKIALFLNSILFLGMIVSEILHYLYRWLPGRDLCWFLFMLHYYANAILHWKQNRAEAVKNLFFGAFLSLMFIPVWLIMLLGF